MALVAVTFCLVMLGGTVTSKGAGLAVPDWPRTYGYNMFLFPPSQWVGNIFWEHTHRLLGSVVGMMCIGICIGLWRTQNARPWLRWTGVGLLTLVIVQGVMGGLRVTELSIAFAVIHGINAQVFLCMTVLIAAATSRFWIERSQAKPNTHRLGYAAYALLAVVLIQLVLGAATRHTNAGLAIPDFPTAYGGVIPPFDQAGIEAGMGEFAASQDNYEFPNATFTPAQVGIHFAHRTWAVVLLITAVCVLFRIAKAFRAQRQVITPVFAIATLLVIQVLLGMQVILSGRHPEIATAHQSIGAAIIAMCALLALRVRLSQPTVTEPIESNSMLLEGAHA